MDIKKSHRNGIFLKKVINIHNRNKRFKENWSNVDASINKIEKYEKKYRILPGGWFSNDMWVGQDSIL